MNKVFEKPQKVQRGFTLIEVLSAVLILAVVTLGIIALFPSGYSQITNAGRISIMNHLAQRKMDQLRMLPISHSDLSIGTHPASPEMNFTNYSTQWTVSAGPQANSVRVVVRVGFDLFESDGTAIPASESLNQKVYEFRTVIAD